ncbi:DUF4824 family protein [Pseudomonas sp. MAP12]|uniref:DUF4824 family protein n=1 Tax=Geopseudomonas aromaticivorans TaxID=2849492 RepID=A0ABS6MVL3_9GAMM|nr:DUF4824 family protein [Pseudomonas aromaticivorans]MBV2132845.1 DUF4824 family protein [Pseudomonas aromaticivorans]
MSRLERRHALLAGVALILLINAFALAGVWYNRSDEPDSRLALSERELGVMSPYLRRENSGLFLQLQWRMPGYWEEDGGRSPRRLSAAQMRQLGFHIPDAADCQPRCRRQAAREVLVVLELDGPAYHAELRRQQESVEQASRALAALPEDQQLQQRLAHQRRELDDLQRDTRLYVVEVGLDRDVLRQRYADRSRYAIVRGLVSPSYGGKPLQLRGYLRKLSNEQINVPQRWNWALAGLPSRARDKSTIPGLRIEVAFGQRLEPWITAVGEARPD